MLTTNLSHALNRPARVQYQALLSQGPTIRHCRTVSQRRFKMATPTSNETCKAFKALHVPGRPLVLANVYDGATANVIAAIPSAKAIASASFAVAAAAGLEDKKLTLEDNLNAVRVISKIAQKAGKPLTVDFQDGYGESLEEGIGALIDNGVAGCNIEDCNKDTLTMYSTEEAVSRIKRALSVAEERGVPDFAINARIDTLAHGGDFEEVLSRGKAYLHAGATSVFVIPGKRGVSVTDIREMVEAFSGKLNIGMPLVSDELNVKKLSELGVARISVGPQLQGVAMKAYKERAEALL